MIGVTWVLRTILPDLERIKDLRSQGRNAESDYELAFLIDKVSDMIKEEEEDI